MASHTVCKHAKSQGVPDLQCRMVQWPVGSTIFFHSILLYLASPQFVRAGSQSLPGVVLVDVVQVYWMLLLGPIPTFSTRS